LKAFVKKNKVTGYLKIIESLTVKRSLYTFDLAHHDIIPTRPANINTKHIGLVFGCFLCVMSTYYSIYSAFADFLLSWLNVQTTKIILPLDMAKHNKKATPKSKWFYALLQYCCYVCTPTPRSGEWGYFVKKF